MITLQQIVSAKDGWRGRVSLLKPRNVVELGTGQGASGAQIMMALPADSLFTTINYVDGHHFGEQLSPWYTDPRLLRVDGDTIDPNTIRIVPGNIDLLFIDTTHEAWHAATELRLWQRKLRHGAVVIVDDLNQHDMRTFWESVPYDKLTMHDDRQGVFRYNEDVWYNEVFYRPVRTTYGPRPEYGSNASNK